MGCSMLFVAIICNFKFIFYEAKTFSEFTQSIYLSSVTVVIIFVLFNFVLKVKKLYGLIDDCESLVNTSELR